MSLVEVLESDEAAEHAAMQEVAAAQQELDDVRAATEVELRAALATGRSVKIDDDEEDGEGQAGGGGNGGKWSHASISTLELNHALSEVEAFPRIGAEGVALAAQARAVLAVRAALYECEWDHAASWAPLAELLEKGGGGGSGGGGEEYEELVAARRELDEMRKATEAAVAAALEANHATQDLASPGLEWSHDTVSTDALEHALAEVEAFPRPSEKGRSLAHQASLIVRLRKAILRCDWGRAASWDGLADLLETAMMTEHSALPEVAAALQVRDTCRAL